MITRLVRKTAETCRVTTSIVVLCALLRNVRCRVVLAPKLRVEKSLLKTHKLVRPTSV